MNNNNYLDKKVASLLIKAQMCSDSGKGIGSTYGREKWKARSNKWGYAHKPQLIFAAFDRISQLKGKSGFSFYIGYDSWNGMDVAYFNFKLDGKRYQISFHMPEGIPNRYRKANTKHHTKWNGIYLGSVDATALLSGYLG